ncbi:MAG: hypothetical protein H7242_04170, partial [Microbacteriaceae bacterium]|nr:hypothetical protein [Burkholderiaceae bacterium]
MDAERATPAALAKGALRRLAQCRQEPTPANSARAYADEAGEALPADGTLPPRARAPVDRLVMRVTDDTALRGEISAALMEARYDDLQRGLDRGPGAAAAQGAGWAQLIDRVARGLERGARHWTAARKKDSLQRVLDGSRSDAQRLQQRLKQLLSAGESDQPDEEGAALVSADAVGPGTAGTTTASTTTTNTATATATTPINQPVAPPSAQPTTVAATLETAAGPLVVAPLPASVAPALGWPDTAGWRVAAELQATVQAALP